MDRKYRILSINPGSTSTKIAVFDNEECVVIETIRHSVEDLAPYQREDRSVIDQKDMRRELVEKVLEEKGISLDSLDAVVGRAGRLPAMKGGTYRVTDDIYKDVPQPLIHAALLGTLIAKDIGDAAGIPSFFVDPTVVDELMDVARITGIPEIRRQVIFHALNQKAVARRYAKSKGTTYKDSRLIIAHMGGGISIAAHVNGLAVDVTTASTGEGPMSPERAGCIPGIPLVDLCFSGKYSHDDMRRFFTQKGGLNAHLGHTDFRRCEADYMEGKEPGRTVFAAMSYQVSKYICSMAAALEGQIDAVIITGGMAYSKEFVKQITERVQFLAPVVVYPGEDEMLSLTEGALRVLRGEEEAIEYVSKGAIEY